jgi:DNA-binding GntR family transcriptional regulator
LSRDWTRQELASAESRQILAGMVDRAFARAQKLFERSLSAIEEAFQADRLQPGPKGSILVIGPDHYARLTAAKRFIELMTAGRAAPKAPDREQERRTLTLQEIEKAVQEAKAAGVVQ